MYEAVLQDVAKWIGEGQKTSLEKNRDADIVTYIIQRLHLRIAAGAATFLIKVKSHRGEFMNEMADIAAERGRHMDDTEIRWTKPSGRIVFRVEKDDKIMQSTWTRGIRAAIRWQGGQRIVRQLQRQGAKVWAKKELPRSTQP